MTKRYSIRRYLTGFVLLWIIVVSLLTTVWVYFDAKHEVDELFDASLVQSARILDGLLHVYPLEGKEAKEGKAAEFEPLAAKIGALDQHLRKEMAQEGHEYEKKVAFQIWDKQGQLIFKSVSAPDKPFSPLEKGFHNAKIFDHGWHTFSLYSEQNNWWLLVAENDEIREELSEKIVRDHILPLIIGIPVLLLILHYLIGRGLSPLNKIKDQLGDKDYKDLTSIHNHETPEEVVGVVNSLNRLFYKLQASYARESRFSADAAHELRNPLASLLIHTENALEDTTALQQSNDYAEDTVIQAYLQQQTQDLGHLKSSIHRLNHDVEQLLALSRAESHTNTADYLSFNLFQLCHQLADEYQSSLEEKQQQLTIEVPDDCHYLGFQSLFTMLVNNLLGNAIKYSPQGSQIRLRAEKKSDTTLVFICEDSGEGIAKAEIGRVKDRFYRIPGNNYGAGLGLSIVDEIVKQHEGSWELASSEELKGLKVTVCLPINTIKPIKTEDHP